MLGIATCNLHFERDSLAWIVSWATLVQECLLDRFVPWLAWMKPVMKGQWPVYPSIAMSLKVLLRMQRYQGHAG